MSNLTERQSQVLDLVRRYIDATGYPPTRADIARELGFRSANAAEEHLRALARKGVIEMTAGAADGARTTSRSDAPRPFAIAEGTTANAAGSSTVRSLGGACADVKKAAGSQLPVTSP